MAAEWSSEAEFLHINGTKIHSAAGLQQDLLTPLVELIVPVMASPQTLWLDVGGLLLKKEGEGVKKAGIKSEGKEGRGERKERGVLFFPDSESFRGSCLEE